MLRVPYVPTLGPVHPDTLSPELFDDVVVASQTGRVLPFDKARRWSPRGHHTVLLEEIIHQPDRTIIPTVSRRAGGMVKTYYYGLAPPDLTALVAATRQWCGFSSAQGGRVIWFDPAAPAPEATSCTRVLLKVFSAPQPTRPHSGRVMALDDCCRAVRATFADFAQRLRATGFGFLHQRWVAGRIDGPVLVAIADHRIIGAIGPLNTLPDRHGHRVLLPPYFGVLPEHRGRGHGRALWRAATAWAQAHRAAYQLLQTETGQVSDRLFVSEGLTCLGFTCSVAA